MGALGLMVLRSGRTRLNLYFIAICVSVIIWLVFTGIGYMVRNDANLAQFWFQADWAGVSFISISVYAFSATLLQLRRPRSIVVGFILASWFAISTLVFNPQMAGVKKFDWGFYPLRDIAWNIPFFLYFFGYMGQAFIDYIAAYLRTNNPLQRNRIKYMFLALLIAYTGSVDYLPTYGFNVYPFGFIGISVFVAISAYAIIRHRLMDVNLAFRYTFIQVLFVSTIAIPMLFLIWWSKSLVIASVVVLVGLWLAPYLLAQWKDSFTEFVDKLVWFQGKYESLKNVGYYERVIVGSVSPRHWYINMVDSVNRLIETESVVGYMFDEELDAYLPQAWAGMDRGAAIRAMRGEKKDLLKFMNEQNGIVFRDALIHELPLDRARQIDSMMEVLGAYLCVPFSNGEKIVGFITVGKKLKKGISFFKQYEVHFSSIKDLLDLPITKDKNKIRAIDQLTGRLDSEKIPDRVSDHEIIDALNSLVDEKELLNALDLNSLNLRSEGIQLLKMHRERGGLSRKQRRVLQTAVLRSLFKDEIGPGPEDLFHAEDIDALTLLFSAGQETLMVMMTAVSQQKKSAEWAHDLRQPFDKGSFTLMDDLIEGKLGIVSDEQKRALFAMKQDSGFVRRKLEALINPQTDSLRIVSCDVRTVLEMFINKIEPVCGHHGLRLISDLPDPGIKIQCDPEIFSFRVLGNIADNAMRHTPRGGTIQIGYQYDGSALTVLFKNVGGEPIATENLKKIFDRGTQIHGDGTIGISGLGLFNVAHAMGAMGGKVWATSSQEEGTTFYMQFPLTNEKP